jgi:tetratricopeptide (TPR) repeat protein
MKTCIATLFLLGIVSSVSGLIPIGQAQKPGGPASSVSLPEGSSAQLQVDSAERQIKADPKKIQAFNDLALAYIKRARETANPSSLLDAEKTIDRGLRLDPEDFQIRKTQVVLLLAQNRFTEAREKATVLNRRIPDDAMIYGYLAEAEIALGDYSEAVKSAQWTLNLRANNIPGLLLAGQLRMLTGDADGSLEVLNLAYKETSPTETEELAWIANQIASVQIDSGKTEAAEATLQRSEQLFPHYPYTLENLARVRVAQHRANDAVQLLVQLKQPDTNPDVLFQLVEARKAAGQSKELPASVAEFRQAAMKLVDQPDNANCDLILLDSEDPSHAEDALKLAQHEKDARHDVWTLDAYAWALYSNGKFQDADVAIQKAIGSGIQNAGIFNHAGHIALKLGRADKAAEYFELSLRANPASEYASDSRRGIGTTAGSAAETTAIQSPEGTASTQPQAANENATDAALDLVPANSVPAFAPVPAALLVPHATDTDRLIRNAQATVARNPKDAKGYAGLGAGYFQRARETGDVNDYQLSEQSLAKSLDLVSTDFSADAALGTMAEVCMGEHRFADALNYSRRALSLGSGDLSSFAIIGDANADMGEYDQAQLAYSRLSVDASSPHSAYARDSRVSYLKFIHGDTTGAIRLMKTAVAEGLQSQLPSENMAWLYYELGEYDTQAGDIAAADAAYLAALTSHPGDYRALAGLAKLRANQGRYTDAIVLYQKAIAVVPMPIFVGELGDIYLKTGNSAEAKKQYQLVEYIGLLGHINQVLHNRDLAIFYADHDMKLAEALELARKEFEVRHDIYTWDALAWALYKNGEYDEAARASVKSLEFGTKDSLLLFHAGLIAEKLGRRDEARERLKAAVTINPHFHLLYADAAQQQLTLLNTQVAAQTQPADKENNAR